METSAKEKGLLVNKEKGKYVTLDWKQGSRIGERIQFQSGTVQSFKYLGFIQHLQ